MIEPLDSPGGGENVVVEGVEGEICDISAVALDHWLAARYLAVLLEGEHQRLASSATERYGEEFGRGSNVVAITCLGRELETAVCVVCPVNLREDMAAGTTQAHAWPQWRNALANGTANHGNGGDTTNHRQ